MDPSGHACEDLPQGSREACINARNALYPPTTTPKSTSTPTPTYYINFNLQSEFTSIIGKVGLENGTVSNVLDSVSTFLDSLALAIDGLIAGGDIGTGL